MTPDMAGKTVMMWTIRMFLLLEGARGPGLHQAGDGQRRGRAYGGTRPGALRGGGTRSWRSGWVPHGSRPSEPGGPARCLNVIPTLEQFERMGAGPSLGYWPWFLLAQPAPFPERLIAADPEHSSGSSSTPGLGGRARSTRRPSTSTSARSMRPRSPRSARTIGRVSGSTETTTLRIGARAVASSAPSC